ncbi:hypothetical protein NC653_028686 [Populus alba x Populus x berolinensis]|uniref:Uncharacterized protein n=1 Tax=Populus alba x Populus x berolinensis TaxID=444605 RepID=A0AAD6M0M7_9ROSI|nr:hypothetical protein NC653_028686 [Populus alba x Populus x berolinensis]
MGTVLGNIHPSILLAYTLNTN